MARKPEWNKNLIYSNGNEMFRSWQRSHCYVAAFLKRDSLTFHCLFFFYRNNISELNTHAGPHSALMQGTLECFRSSLVLFFFFSFFFHGSVYFRGFVVIFVSTVEYVLASLFLFVLLRFCFVFSHFKLSR